MVRSLVADWEIKPEIVVGPAAKWQAFAEADAAIAASGTVILELGLAGVPVVSTYSTDWIVKMLHKQITQLVQTAVFLISTLLKRNCQQEYEALLEDRLADLIDVLGFDDPAVRELAIRRSALRLGGPAWWRTTDDTDA